MLHIIRYHISIPSGTEPENDNIVSSIKYSISCLSLACMAHSNRHLICLHFVDGNQTCNRIDFEKRIDIMEKVRGYLEECLFRLAQFVYE
jgi:hypothetical protein